MGTHELSNAMTAALLSYVRRIGGDGKIAALLELAGERRSFDELSDHTRWSTYDQAHALFTAAVLVMNDPDIGRRAGEELLAAPDETGVQAYLQSLAGPGDIVRLVAQISAKMSTVTDMELVAATDDWALVSATTRPPVTRDRIFCDYTAGALSRSPVRFGMDPAEVSEIQCQTRGDARCLYKVAWDASTGPDTSPDRHVALLNAQIEILTHRIESLETVAADIASQSDIPEMLRMITMRASLAARGQKYVLAVQLPGDPDLKIHHVGCTEEEARIRAAEILAPDEPAIRDGDGSRLVVDIASVRHHFGRLAVFYPEGYSFLPQEHRQLRAYAGYAAAALETTAALDEARRRGDFLHATVNLASALAQSRTAYEAADILASSIASVVDCSRACMLLWEPRDEIFVRTATFSAAGGDGTEDGFPAPSFEDGSPAPSFEDGSGLHLRGGSGSSAPTSFRSPQLATRMLRSLEPVAVDRSTDDPALQAMLALCSMPEAILVPIAVQAELFGVLAVGSGADGLPPALRLLAEPALHERLVGVANIAAPAFKTASLIARMHYEALHDPLTGLPNVRLLQEEIVRALSHAERESHRSAVLFVDLDRFADVNDALGHVAADDVLRAVALIMRSAVRRGDVVARLAGDQFAIVLPKVHGVQDAELVAGKILSALDIPFDDFDRRVAVSASIGIAVFPEHGSSYDDLLGHSDAAMREAKASGGRRLLVART